MAKIAHFAQAHCLGTRAKFICSDIRSRGCRQLGRKAYIEIAGRDGTSFANHNKFTAYAVRVRLAASSLITLATARLRSEAASSKLPRSQSTAKRP